MSREGSCTGMSHTFTLINLAQSFEIDCLIVKLAKSIIITKLFWTIKYKCKSDYLTYFVLEESKLNSHLLKPRILAT